MPKASAPPSPSPRMSGSPWSVPDAAAFLRVSVRSLERMLAARKAKSIRLGGRRLIPDAEVRRLSTEGTK